MSTGRSHLVYVPYIDINIGSTEDPYSQSPVDGPQRLAGCLAVHVGCCRGDAPGVRWQDEVVCGQLTVQAVLGH